MPTLFYRLTTDDRRTDVPLENLFAGTQASACWLIGGGPSLNGLPLAEIQQSPAPKFTINLAGTKLLRPDFWTSYDPSARFHRSVYLDAGVMKFVHRRRATDLVPGTTGKVCDCPNLFFFDRDSKRSFSDFLSPAHPGIVDWADSFAQALDIIYRLGFRRVYLAGCELRIHPSPEQIQAAARVGVTYNPRGLLREFVEQCRQAGLSSEQLEQLPAGQQYHFDESKPLAAAVTTDSHYFRISQYLRLSRRSITLAGLQLISVTPDSRLNDYFPYLPAAEAIREIHRLVGDPQQETTRGNYQQYLPGHDPTWGVMKDFKPHQAPPPAAAAGADLLIEAEGFERLRSKLDREAKADPV